MQTSIIFLGNIFNAKLKLDFNHSFILPIVVSVYMSTVQSPTSLLTVTSTPAFSTDSTTSSSTSSSQPTTTSLTPDVVNTNLSCYDCSESFKYLWEPYTECQYYPSHAPLRSCLGVDIYCKVRTCQGECCLSKNRIMWRFFTVQNAFQRLITAMVTYTSTVSCNIVYMFNCLLYILDIMRSRRYSE